MKFLSYGSWLRVGMRVFWIDCWFSGRLREGIRTILHWVEFPILFLPFLWLTHSSSGKRVKQILQILPFFAIWMKVGPLSISSGLKAGQWRRCTSMSLSRTSRQYWQISVSRATPPILLSSYYFSIICKFQLFIKGYFLLFMRKCKFNFWNFGKRLKFTVNQHIRDLLWVRWCIVVVRACWFLSFRFS